MNDRIRTLLLAALFGHVVLALWMVERATINADEGWYLYAAGQIADGAVPYRDFLLFQAPVMPTVYSGLVSPGAGVVLGARWWSLLMLLMATGMTALAARRGGGNRAALIATVCMGLHPLVVSTAVLAKPYALAMMLTSASVFVLSGDWKRPVRVVVGLALLTLAAGARLSLLPAVLILVWCLRGVRVWGWVGVAVATGLVLPTAIGASLHDVWAQAVGFHLTGAGEAGWFTGRLAWGLNVGLTFGVVAVLGLVRPSSCGRTVPGLGLAGVAVVGLHLIPTALHVEHVIIALPLLAVWVGVRWARVDWSPRMVGVGALVAIIGSLSGLRWVHLDSGPSTLQQVADTGAWIRAHTDENRPLLTLQTTVAVEADRRVPPGFEMGRFGWASEDVQRALGPMMGGAAIAAGDFARDPMLQVTVTQWVSERFPVERTVPTFGQFGESLRLLGPPTAIIVTPLATP